MQKVQSDSVSGTGSAAGQICLVCKAGTYAAAKLPGLKCCPLCGFLTADLNLGDAELEKLYGEDYFHGDEYRDYKSEEESLRFNFRRRIETLKTLVSDFSTLKVFEIGSAYGFFLQEVKPDVEKAQGIDISIDATAAARGKGLDVATGNYLDHSVEPDVRLIAMWDTIEHLGTPDLFIEKAAQDLAPGGYIAVTTGDIESLNAKFRGKHWRMIHPPTHLHYFSVSTLSKLLERNGFDVVHVSHPGNSRDLRSILHFIVELRLGWKWLYARIANWRIFNVSLTLNLFDIMFIVAQKRKQPVDV